MAGRPSIANSVQLPGLGACSEPATRRSPTYWAQSHAAPSADSPVTLPERMSLLRRFGSFSLAYSTAVQPHLRYFGNSSGYIAYRQRGGITFALGDPVCAAERREELLREFMAAFRKPSFVQIHRETAATLSHLGFAINEMGLDTCLDLNDYSFNGKEKEWLRYADNWVRKHGFQTVEINVRQREAEIAALSEAWRSTRTIKRKEVRFLNRPIVLDEEPDTRRFGLIDAQQRLVAFVFFDPVYADGKVRGYVTCFKRRLPDAPPAAEPAIMKRAIEHFQKEGLQQVWLGLSPLANIENRDFPCNQCLHWATRYYHRAGWLNKYFYNFQGHTQYKSRFRGREVKVYYATPVWWNTYRLLTLSSLCGAF